MATKPRSIWRGHLRLALVTCPVALYNARHERDALKFHMINPATGNRVKMVTLDAGTDQEIKRGDTVKGFEYSKGRNLILTKEDIDSVKVESSTIMSVEKFVDAGSIDPKYFDACYYLAPDGDAGREVFAVLMEAIAQTNKAALTRVVISQRERNIALRAVAGGLMAHTLYEDRDLNRAEEVFDQMQIKLDPAMVQLAKELVERQAGAYEASDTEDRYETRLRALIDAKLKGEGIAVTVEDKQPSNVIDLMAALRGSLGQGAEAKQKEEPKRKKRA